MTLFMLAWKSLRHHLLSTCITTLSIALSGGLLMSIWVIQSQSREAFTSMDGGFDAVLGVRSSPLQLVLNALFHLEASPGNLKAEDYLQISKHPSVAAAYPMALGDNYRGYRLVGTSTNLFTEHILPSGNSPSPATGGRIFASNRREALVGSLVANRIGIKVGQVFHPYHGLNFNEEHEHEEDYVVVGILEPTGTPMDRVIWIPLMGLQKMSGHNPESEDELSAVLIKLKSPQAGFRLDLQYNKEGNRLTFAWPIGRIVAGLFDKFRWFDLVLQLVAWLVALISVGSVMAGMYNSIHARKRDFAILRALGARRATVMGSIVLEAVAIGFLGMAAGFVLYLTLTTLVAELVQNHTGVLISPFVYDPILWIAPLAIISACGISGLLPGWKAYRTEVVEHLSPVT